MYTLEASPADYAMTQNNLGTALAGQADLFAGPERAAHLELARTAFLHALHIYTEAEFPHQNRQVKANVERLSKLSAT